MAQQPNSAGSAAETTRANAPADRAETRSWRSWILDRTRLTLAVAVVLMLLGSLLATWVNTGAGAATVTEVTIFGTNGYQISAYVYTPKTATAQTPAPGILMFHGLNNQKDYMDNTALEMARRGFVVVSADMTGHGSSNGANSDNGCGGPDALKYLDGLAVVDKTHIGLIGMSQGGFCAVTAAALAVPDGYSSIFYMESEPNPPGVPNVKPYVGLKNIAFNIGSFTELGGMVFIDKGSQAPMSIALLPLFGVEGPIVPGKVYGSIADGTARMLYQPWEDHALSTDSTGAIGNAIDWMQRTLTSGGGLAPSDQIWPFKLLGTAAALFGAFLFLFAAGSLLLRTSQFKTLVRPIPQYQGLSGIGWWIGALVTTAIGPLLYLWVWNGMFFEGWLTANTLWPQTFTNIYMVWGVFVGVIAWALITLDHFVFTKRQGATLESYGLAEPNAGFDWPAVRTALLLVVAVLAPLYVGLDAIKAVWHVDFRAWVVALMPMSAARWSAFFGYLIPFGFYFAAQGIIFAGFLRWRKGNASLGMEMFVNAVVMTLGALIWILLLYVPLLGGGTQILATGQLGPTAAGLGGIYYIPLLVLWPLAACLYTFYFRKTGRVYAGIFMVTIFMVWTLAAFGDFAVWPIIG
jgi:hypothetical protein